MSFVPWQVKLMHLNRLTPLLLCLATLVAAISWCNHKYGLLCVETTYLPTSIMTLHNTQVVTRRSARNLQRLAGIVNPINSGVSQNNSENRCILLGSITGTENTKSPSRIPNVSNSIYPGSADGTENTKSPTRIPNVSYNIYSSSVDGTENTKSPTRIPNVSNGATAQIVFQKMWPNQTLLVRIREGIS